MLLLGESKIDYVNTLAVSHDPPFPESEIWTCNAGFRIWPHDLLFVMDDLEGEAHKWPQYGKDLAGHDQPIITSTAYKPWSNAIAFPIREVCRDLGLVGLDIWFNNSLPYMLAYAVWIGVKHVTVFGADYWHPHSQGREGDIENAHFWLGFLRGRGLTLSVANNSTLMNARNSQRPMYGYRHDPRISMQREAEQKAKHEHEQAARRDLSQPLDIDLSQGAERLVAEADNRLVDRVVAVTGADVTASMPLWVATT